MVIDHDTNSNSYVLHVANLLDKGALASFSDIERRNISAALKLSLFEKIKLITSQLVAAIKMETAHDCLAIRNVPKVGVGCLDSSVYTR